MQVSVQEHDKIIEAFRNRNADLAEQLVRKNAEYGGKVLVQAGDGAYLPKPEQAIEMDI
jgi:DNA-binding GntR family transcriptional regulator